MTDLGAKSPAQTPTKRLRFDRYVLDLDRGALLLAGNDIALRPKTFAVLRYLVENSGRLVSKDELFTAVWPNLAVTDDVLVQGIGELRRAFGADGSRLIRTIPRRGYRLEADASTAGSYAWPSGVSTPPPVDSDAPSTAISRARSFARPRIGLLALLVLTVLVTAGALWSGVEWRFSGYGHRTARAAIAVLPIVYQGDDPSREHLADGLTQDVINALGRFSALTVMSWNAVFPFKGKPASPGEVARRLAVRYQFEGSVRQSGDRVRVSAQLVDADGRVLWSGSFDDALADLFALQDKITNEIVRTLAIRVTQIEQRRVLAKPTENLEAYDYVLRARPALQRPSRASNVEARALLQRAIQLDPGYAAAYASLAETYHIDVAMGWAQSPAVSLRRAGDMANQALHLNDSEVRARIILGRIHLFYQRYEQAQAEIDRAIAINSNDADGLAGRGNILLWLGQTDAAIEVLELARRIDPELNAIDRNALILAYYLKRRYEAAIQEAEINLRQTESAHFSRAVLAAAYAQQGRPEDAARVVATIRNIDPTFDPQKFGTKFLNSVDLERLRDGLRKAGL